MKKNQIIIFALIGALAVILIIFLLKPKENKPITLNGVEVTDYKGEQLTPISETPALGIKGTQNIDIKTYKLTITGLVDKTLNYTYDDVVKLHQTYTKVVTLNCVEGWSAKSLFEGVLIYDLLKDAGISPKANTVIFYCSDSYTTSLPLDYIRDEKILFAYKMNGITLPPEQGFPFRVVAEAKYGYKWAKWVTKIEVSDDPNYKGYWEESGYSNDANISQP
jgi:DMSO/TMAO reductase YedYZ molybdopterin-dependent catalytic subunit